MLWKMGDSGSRGGAKRTVTWRLQVLLLPGVLLGCGPDGGHGASGGQGTGGTSASGGTENAGGTGGSSSGGTNGPDGTLQMLECQRGQSQNGWTVQSTTCWLSADGISLWARTEYDETSFPGDYPLVAVALSGLEPGVRLTDYGGTMTWIPGNHGPNSATLGAIFCSGPSSVYTPDPCEIELLTLERGEVQAGGAGGTAVEEGSRVRLRVACPDGLYAPGGDDYGPTLVELIPEEFELEARDCIVALE